MAFYAPWTLEARMDRRVAVAAMAAGVAGLGLLGCAHGAAAGKSALAGRAVVLVHGAWHGGWCWREVAARLRAEGAMVFTPTLTGLGARAHLRTPTPTLSTHVADVAGLIETEELERVILVGHSYGGMVVTGVADRLKPLLAHVVYLDAALPGDGQSMISQRPGVTQAERDASLAQLKGLAPDGEWMAPPPAAVFGVPAGPQAAWVQRRLTPHPLSSWTEPLALGAGGSEGLARTYVLCTDPILPNTAFPAHAARIRAGEAGTGWRSVDLPTGHDAMITAPQAVAKIIAQAA